MSAHTPGPLLVRPSPSYADRKFLDIEPEAGRNGCLVRVFVDETNPARSEADARLYAAAPSLLEALQNLMGLYDTPVERRRKASDPFYAEAVSTALSAIHAATGEK
jgi:hypothetical protein